jgi:Tfp pilus assembly protein PilX
MLVAVLGMLGVITVLVGVMVAMTGTALRTSEEFADSATIVNAADSALESVISDLRRNRDAALQDCFGATDQGSGHTVAYSKNVAMTAGQDFDVIVDCETNGALTEQRDVTLRAFVQGQAGGSSGPDGASRAVIVDRIGTVDRPGVALRICDWQLGQSVGPELVGC